MGVNPFARYDLDYLQPPEPDEETAEEREDDYWNEVDRAYAEHRDRETEHDYDYLDLWEGD